MRPLRILLPVHVFFPEHFYGTETYTLQLAQCLRQMGHRPTVLTSVLYGEKGRGGAVYTYEHDGFEVDCIDQNIQPLTHYRQLHRRADFYPLIAEIFRKRSPDVVHVNHLMGHTGVLLEVVRDMGLAAVATLTDFYGICPNSKLMRYDEALCTGPEYGSTNCLACYIREHEYEFVHRKLLATAIRSNGSLKWTARLLPFAAALPGFRRSIIADRIGAVRERIGYLRSLYAVYRKMITPTAFLHEAYVRNGFYPEKLHKIHFGIDLNVVKPFRKDPGRMPAPLTFGYIGQITPHKGVDLLVEAFVRLQADNARLLLFGPRDQSPGYMRQIETLASGNARIAFRDTFPSDRLGEVLSEIDVLVIPSRWYENSPLVLLYALASKTPVIVTDMKGMSEFVIDGWNGYMFQKDNMASLLGKMKQLTERPEIWMDLCRNADYSKGVMDHAREVEAIYQAILGEGATSAGKAVAS